MQTLTTASSSRSYFPDCRRTHGRVVKLSGEMMMQQDLGALTRSFAAGEQQSDMEGCGSSSLAAAASNELSVAGGRLAGQSKGCTAGAAASRYGAATAAAAVVDPQQQQQQQLKCPRCDSRNTKFCYYNNYSFSQPRHFCKNCRRYWTEGGALRNVPVGGGCRKNKRSAVAMGVSIAGSSSSSKLHIRSSISSDDPQQSHQLHGLNAPFLQPAAAAASSPIGGDQLSCSSLVDIPQQTALIFSDHGFPGLIHGQKRHPDLNVADASSLNHLLQPLLDTRGCFTNASSAHDLSTATAAATYMDQLSHYFDQPATTHIRMNPAHSATATLASIEDQLSNFSSTMEHFTTDQHMNSSSSSQQQQRDLLQEQENGRLIQHKKMLGSDGAANPRGGVAAGAVEIASREPNLCVPRVSSKECFYEGERTSGNNNNNSSSSRTSWSMVESQQLAEMVVAPIRHANNHNNNVLGEAEPNKAAATSSSGSWSTTSRWPDCVRSSLAGGLIL